MTVEQQSVDERIAEIEARPAKFVQISFGASSCGCDLYALDLNGDVWSYVWIESAGRGWHPLAMTRQSVGSVLPEQEQG